MKTHLQDFTDGKSELSIGHDELDVENITPGRPSIRPPECAALSIT